MKTFGDKIRKIREIKGLKQESIAKELGLSVNQYGKLERNEAKLSLERLTQIAQALDVAVEEILAFDGETVYFGNTNSIFNHFNIVSDSGVQNQGGLAQNEREHYEDKILMLKEKINLLEELIKEIKKGTN